MIGSVLSAWLKDEGLSRSAIGLFGAVVAVYSFNWIWSPLVDRLKIYGFGQRKGWIFMMQCGVLLCCITMSQLNAGNHLFWIALCCFMLALFSATQDIAIDGYRIDVIESEERDKMSAASAVATAGWWTGYAGLGALPFFLADSTDWYWPQLYLIIGGVMALLILGTLFTKEPDIDRAAMRKAVQGTSNNTGAFLWVQQTIIFPFKEFFTRNGVKVALSFLLFIFLFKLGEAFLGRMSIVFYKEIGFTNSEIGGYSKLLNWWVTIIFSLIGGLINIRYGIYRGLMIAGIAMAASNLMFAVIAEVGPDVRLLTAAVIVDGFTAAWSTVAMVAFISLLCNKAFSATQYALMASLSVAGRSLVASTSGFMVDYLEGNWSLFFIATALMVIPSLLFLYNIRERINTMEASR